MPIYDYSCSACGHLTEVIHGINDHGPRYCPECGAEGTMKKEFATPAVHFKGSGWAKKDRKATSSPGKPSAAKPASGESTATAGGSSAPSGESSAASTTTTSTGDGGTD